MVAFLPWNFVDKSHYAGMVGLSLTDVQYRCNLMEKIQIQAELLVVVSSVEGSARVPLKEIQGPLECSSDYDKDRLSWALESLALECIELSLVFREAAVCSQSSAVSCERRVLHVLIIWLQWAAGRENTAVFLFLCTGHLLHDCTVMSMHFKDSTGVCLQPRQSYFYLAFRNLSQSCKEHEVITDYLPSLRLHPF